MRSAGCRPLAITACAGLAVPGAAAHVEGSKALPPGYTTTGTGDVHDFDYFAGGWTTRHAASRRGASAARSGKNSPATLDTPEAFPPTREIWLEQRLPWESLNEALPHYARSSVGASPIDG